MKKYKNITQAAMDIVGVPYYNGATKRMFLKHLEENNIQIDDIIEKKQIRKCKECGIELNSSKKIFCSSSCAAKYNNRNRKHSSATKEKISNSVKLAHEKSVAEIRKNWERKDLPHELICKHCGKKFYSRNVGQIYCSKQCMHQDAEYANKIRNLKLDAIKNGTIIRWTPRNVESRFEAIWQSLLDEHRIIYKKEDNSHKPYRMDFCVIKDQNKIDVEIDGKQHTYKDRVKHDVERDESFVSAGYLVYRVAVPQKRNIDIEGYLMHEFDKFLEFYQSI